MDDSGDYRDSLGRLYVRSGKRNPVFVNVDGPLIRAKWRGKGCKLNLAGWLLPEEIILTVHAYAKWRLESMAPPVLNSINNLLKFLEGKWQVGWANFSPVPLMQLIDWIVNETSELRTELRKFYSYCAKEGVCGADEIYSIELDDFRFPRAKPLEAVLNWHETKGAMTGAEQELVRKKMMARSEDETVTEMTTRLYVWILFETLKRPSQIADMQANALWKPVESEDQQYFLRIPKVKYQAGRPDDIWPITNELANEIIFYSSSEFVQHAQQKTNTLLVSAKLGMRGRHGVNLNKWSKAEGIVSPRTFKPLKITPYRIRHSAATQMAMEGASSEEIQHVLEHDSEYAVRTYIDSLASNLCPLLDQVGRNLGGLFLQLNDYFFKGEVVDRDGGAPILIPSVSVPAVIGSCGKKGSCGSHPFFTVTTDVDTFLLGEMLTIPSL